LSYTSLLHEIFKGSFRTKNEFKVPGLNSDLAFHQCHGLPDREWSVSGLYQYK